MRGLPLLLVLAACGQEYDVVHDLQPGERPGDVAPIADPGPGALTHRDRALTLDGSASFDPDHDEARLAFAWSVVEQPAGAEVALDGDDTATPSFRADTLGLYRLALVVTDEDGIPSENPAEVVVEVAPWEDLEVQLVWDRPVDLDLHLVAPGGAYYTDADCFFANPAPDWGTPGDGTDNPALSADADASGGPEEIRLPRPGEGVYEILVQYYNRRDVANASVRPHLVVRAAGVVIDDVIGPTMTQEGQVWAAGTLDWSTMTFVAESAIVRHEDLGGAPYNE